jgi:hypothetical protein
LAEGGAEVVAAGFLLADGAFVVSGAVDWPPFCPFISSSPPDDHFTVFVIDGSIKLFREGALRIKSPLLPAEEEEGSWDWDLCLPPEAAAAREKFSSSFSRLLGLKVYISPELVITTRRFLLPFG